MLTNAQAGTATLANHIDEYSAARFPDDRVNNMAPARLRPYVTDTQFHLNTDEGWNCERRERCLSPLRVNLTVLFALNTITKRPPLLHWRLLVHHVRAKRLDSQPGKNEAFPRTSCPVRRRGRFNLCGQANNTVTTQVLCNSTMSCLPFVFRFLSYFLSFRF